MQKEKVEICIKSLDEIRRMDGYYISYNHDGKFMESNDLIDIRIYSTYDHTFCPIKKRNQKYFGTKTKLIAKQGSDRVYTIFLSPESSLNEMWNFVIWEDCVDQWVEFPDFISKDEMLI